MFELKRELSDIREQLFALSFDLGAIQLDMGFPFRWASGYRMPIYNDSRLLLASPKARKIIVRGLELLLESDNSPNIAQHIAGVATGGIVHAALLAQQLQLPMQYIRASKKDHGLLLQIEGLPHYHYNGETVAIIEDVISTGESSLQAIQIARTAGATILGCFAVYSYGFPKAEQAFIQAEISCQAIINFCQLLHYIDKCNLFTQSEISQLQQWHRNPFTRPSHK